MSTSVEIGDHLRDEIRWLLFYRSNPPDLFKRGDQIAIDLSKASFIIPFCLLSFLAYSKSLCRKTKRKVLLCNIPTNPPICQYMERTDFFVLASRYIEIEGNYSAVPLWNRDVDSQKLLGIVEIGRNRIDSALKIAHFPAGLTLGEAVHSGQALVGKGTSFRQTMSPSATSGERGQVGAGLAVLRQREGGGLADTPSDKSITWRHKKSQRRPSDLSEAEIDDSVQILDRNAKGNTSGSEAVAKLMIAQGAQKKCKNVKAGK